MVNNRGEVEMALKKKQIKLLADQILENDTDSDDAADFCSDIRSIMYGFEDDEGIELEDADKKAVFERCMKTFTDPEYNAAYPIGFIRGLMYACEIKEPVTITLS